MASKTPTRAGIEVTLGDKRGITTSDMRRSGKIGVIFIGGPYDVLVTATDLTTVEDAK